MNCWRIIKKQRIIYVKTIVFDEAARGICSMERKGKMRGKIVKKQR